MMEREKSREELLAELEALQRKIGAAEDALKESEVQLQRITNNMFDIITQTDLGGVIRYVSPSNKSILGYEPEEVLGRTVYDYIYPGDIDKMMPAVLRAIATSSNVRIEYRLRHANGHYLWLESVISPILDDNGIVAGGIFVTRDITERKHAEAALRESEEQLRRIADNMLDMVCQTDARGIVQYASPSNESVLGYRPEDLLGKPLSNLVHPDDLNRVVTAFQILQTAINASLRGKIEFRFKHADGRYLWAEVIGKPLFDDMGMVIGAIFGGRDITERKNAEESLRRTASELQTVFHALPDLYFRLSADGAFLDVQAGQAGDLYIPKEMLLGKRIQDVSFKYGQLFQQAIGQVLKTRSLTIIEYTITSSNNKKFFEARFLPLLEDQVVVVVRNITEHKQAEERLKYLSFHDTLTGIYNRSYFEEELKRLDTKRQMPLSIIMGDVNGLKIVNDTFGHQEGDRLLIDAAMILKKICRKEDMVCRFGGDEFAILLPKTKKETAVTFCNRLRRACEKTERELVPISFALGVATREKIDQTFDVVLREAEHMMYQDKPLDSRSARFSMITFFQRALADKSAEPMEHGRRIQDLVKEIGNRLGLSGKEQGEMNLLAALHDIGQIAIPTDMLMKPCYLTENEWELMKKHPEIGEQIARSVPDLVSIAEAILSHHERWDGTGYPQGLKGKQIPLFSRILAIADAYDVMINGRPYKKAINHREAVEEIKNCAGTQFDPELVKPFVEALSCIMHS
jgi:diguanylate cyclase (GGDEF)-like protein/PAS domain S-box-containing protein